MWNSKGNKHPRHSTFGPSPYSTVIVSEMTYNVSSGTLNPTIPYHTQPLCRCAGHTYRSDKYQFGDDSARVKMTLQMADAAASVESSVHALTLGAKFGLAMIFRGLQMMCVRSLTEVPELVLEPAWNRTVNTTQGLVRVRILSSRILCS